MAGSISRDPILELLGVNSSQVELALYLPTVANTDLFY